MSNSFIFKVFPQLIVAEIFGIISLEPLDIYFKLSLNGWTEVFKDLGYLCFMCHQVYPTESAMVVNTNQGPSKTI